MTKTLFGLGAALVVAVGLFGFKMLVAPPVTLAAPSPAGMEIHGLVVSTPTDLPSFDDKYQRHLGVLDVLPKGGRVPE